MLRLLTSIILLFISVSARGVPFPFISSVELDTSLSTVSYYFKYQVLETNDPQATWIPPRGYYVALNRLGFQNWDIIFMNSVAVIADGKKTFATLAMEVYNKGLPSRYGSEDTWNSHPSFEKQCWNIGANSSYHASTPPIKLACAYIQPENKYCKIVTPTINFDHQVLSPSETLGNIARTDIKINCSVKATIRLSLISESQTIAIGSVGKTTITANNSPLGTPISVAAGLSNIRLTSKLSSLPPGEWKADHVLIIKLE